MRAYGYEYITKKSMQDKSIRINELIEELQRRYPNGSEFDSVLMLKEANPDLAGQMASLQIKKEVYIEAGILKIPDRPCEDDLDKLCDELLVFIREKFPEGPQWLNRAGLTNALPEARGLIDEIQEIMKKTIHRPFVEEMKKRGIFAENVIDKRNAKKEGNQKSSEYFHRICLLGRSDTTLSSMSRQSYGMTFFDYKACRERSVPHGKIGEALDKLKNLFFDLELSAYSKNTIPEAAVWRIWDDLKKITECLGYNDVDSLLYAYGYTIVHQKN